VTLVNEHNLSQSLQDELNEISENCNKCGLCTSDCEFLKTYGFPKDIAAFYDINSRIGTAMPFECSLCSLCAALCLEGLNPKKMFLEMRRDLNRTGKIRYSRYSKIINYEKRGISKRYSCYIIPEKCTTVFFPGCTLSGTRSGKTYELYAKLKKIIPDLGIVLDCCTKPSHDLGRDDFFNEKFGELKKYLSESGIVKVIVACPNCFKIFSEYGNSIKVETVYEVIDKKNIFELKNLGGSVNVHDPCGVRFNTFIYNAVRNIISRSGLTIVEGRYSKEKSFCCGEGGAVNLVNRKLAGKWIGKIKEDLTESKVITYCAGCVNFLKPHIAADHLIDLLFEPENSLSGKVKITRAPLTYLKRLKLKKRLIKNSVSAEIYERGVAHPGNKQGKIIP
jgi:Fe-S oxidoreductase